MAAAALLGACYLPPLVAQRQGRHYCVGLQVPVALMDGIIGFLDLLAKVLPQLKVGSAGPLGALRSKQCWVPPACRRTNHRPPCALLACCAMRPCP